MTACVSVGKALGAEHLGPQAPSVPFAQGFSPATPSQLAPHRIWALLCHREGPRYVLEGGDLPEGCACVRFRGVTGQGPESFLGSRHSSKTSGWAGNHRGQQPGQDSCQWEGGGWSCAYPPPWGDTWSPGWGHEGYWWAELCPKRHVDVLSLGANEVALYASRVFAGVFS